MKILKIEKSTQYAETQQQEEENHFKLNSF